MAYVCALCKKTILPGARYIYITREYKDKNGNKATELAKAHAYHRIENVG